MQGMVEMGAAGWCLMWGYYIKALCMFASHVGLFGENMELLPWGCNYSVILISAVLVEAGDKIAFLSGEPFANEVLF